MHCCCPTFNNPFSFRSHTCITFELLSINLYELIKKNKFQGFSLQLVRKFAHSLLQCLDTLYRNKIIHCDMKPENVLLKQQGRSGIKVGIFLCLSLNPVKPIVAVEPAAKTKAEEITFVRRHQNSGLGLVCKSMSWRLNAAVNYDPGRGLDVCCLLYSPRPPLGLVAVVEMVTITFVLPSLPPPSARLMEAGGLLWAEYFCNAGDTSLHQILIHLGSAHPEEILDPQS